MTKYSLLHIKYKKYGKIRYTLTINFSEYEIYYLYGGNMSYIYTPYIWPYLVTIFLNLLMSLYVLKNKSRNGAIAFVFTLFFCSLWCLGSAMILCSNDYNTKLFWIKLCFPAYALAPMSWMIMVLQISDLWHHICKREKLILFFSIPFISILLAWTNDFHGLIWANISIDTNNIVNPTINKYGFWFWVHSFYSDLINILSIFIIIWSWRKKTPLYSKQFTSLMYSIAFVIFINALYILKVLKYDLTPVAWGISSPLIIWALFRHKLFNLVPIAQTRVIENLKDGIVVIDLQNRIVDINTAAKYILKCETIKTIGTHISHFFDRWPALHSLVIEKIDYLEFEQTQSIFTYYYEALCLPIKNEREFLLGKLLIIRDITVKKQTEAEILQKQQEIAVKEERERIARDLHDNFGQTLGFVNVQTQAIKEYLKRGCTESAIQCLERLTVVTQQAQKDTREIILSMREEIKNTKSFFVELTNLINSFEKCHELTIKIDYTGIENFEIYDNKFNANILNIIKESLNNIVKHSGADTVQIVFQENSNWINIGINDNGCGFDVNVSHKVNHYGLIFMEERAKEIDGYLNIDSHIGNGTIIKIIIPKAHTKQLIKN